MEQSIHQPHDKLFKRAMTDMRVAQDFFQQHLPEQIKTHIDFQSLKFIKETFVDQDFKAASADVVYSASFDKKPAYLYILVEHQSTVDAGLVLRLMHYMLRLLDHHRKQYPQEKCLPIIYPLIFYSGKEPYAISTNFFDLFGEYDELVKSIWTRPFHLIDIQNISDEEMRQHMWSGILEFVLKHQYQRDFLQVADKVLEWVHMLEIANGYDYAKSILYYIIDGIEGKEVRALLELAQGRLSHRLGGETMTFAEQLIQEGRQEGRQEGIQKGRQEGRQEGLKEGVQKGQQRGMKVIAKRLLAEKMAVSKIAELTELSAEEILALQSE